MSDPLTWRTSVARWDHFVADTPLGLCTVALRPAAGRQKVWTARLEGKRVATGRTSAECKQNAEAQIARAALSRAKGAAS